MSVFSNVPWSWLFLAVALLGAWLTLNAHRPVRGYRWFVVPSFLAGWLTAELAAHHLVLQLGIVGFFLSMGGLDAWPGWVAMGLTLASWGGLVALVLTSFATPQTVERALEGALGADYRAQLTTRLARRYCEPPRVRWWMPFVRSARDVMLWSDVRYAPGAGRRHLLDVYTPASGVQNAPVLLQIHGGGWVVGHKRQQAVPLLLHMAARGWVCVSINYRLSPRATFPEHLIDCKLALAWVRHHIATYGGDPDYVVVTGGSAGGHLASMVALTANDPEYQPGFEQVDTRVRACVSLYGVYDLTDRFGHQPHAGLRMMLESWVIKRRFAEAPELFDRASPMSRVGPDAPPFFVIHGECDCMASLEDARSFVAALRASAEGPMVVVDLKGAHHSFEIFHSMRTSHVVHAIARFLAFVHARDTADASASRLASCT